MTRSGAISTIDTLLSGVSDPTFRTVFRGEPMSVPETPCVAFWFAGRDVDFTTFTDVSSLNEFTIRAYWRLQASTNIREDIELELWNASVSIPTALRGDSDLSGNVTDMTIGASTTAFTEIGGIAYRTLDIPLTLINYSEVTITP